MRTFGTKQLAGGNRTTENVYVYENLNVPVRVTSRYAGVGEPATIEVLFTELSSEPRHESEFTLTHYGLPEFAAPLEPISRYLVFSACGAVLIVSGLVYFFVKRKSF